MGEGAVYVIARDGDVKRTMANEEGVVEGALGSVEMWSVGLAQTEGENMGMASLSLIHTFSKNNFKNFIFQIYISNRNKLLLSSCFSQLENY